MGRAPRGGLWGPRWGQWRWRGRPKGGGAYGWGRLGRGAAFLSCYDLVPISSQFRLRLHLHKRLLAPGFVVNVVARAHQNISGQGDRGGPWWQPAHPRGGLHTAGAKWEPDPIMVGVLGFEGLENPISVEWSSVLPPSNKDYISRGQVHSYCNGL